MAKSKSVKRATTHVHSPAGVSQPVIDAESARLAADDVRKANWKRWGTYLAERQWSTVREDYSPDGTCWEYFPHDHARSRAYRWGEDGLMGWCDRQCRLCFAIALWNGKDPILKERLFGLTGAEGNHGEDVKELYYYLDATPTHSYAKALYKYPQNEYPYARLIDGNRGRPKDQVEFELLDTGVFDDNRYFDVMVEYAKADEQDICIRLTVTNRGPETAPLWLLPQLWFRNTWSWGDPYEDKGGRPSLHALGDTQVSVRHPTLGQFFFDIDAVESVGKPTLLFTENETNHQRLFGQANPSKHVKDAFHDYVVSGREDAVSPDRSGTKCAAMYRFDIEAGKTVSVRLRLRPQDVRLPGKPLGRTYEETFDQRIAEADTFYANRIPGNLTDHEKQISRQAYAGMLWTKQFYYYVVETWLDGDPTGPKPPRSRKRGRNSDWEHLFNRDIISMPDKWEYPWYAAWDLAFHMVTFAKIDPSFAKEQLQLMLREWYMHPNGQIPAYEFAFGDVNPPVHAWACWRVYKMTAPRGQRDRLFLERCFQKLLLNFTWWVNRKDPSGRHVFAGGFLGLDNIGVFDRSRPLPTGGVLEQADGTAWMAFYCLNMLSMALELALDNPVYEDIASKFFEHFVAITDAINTLGGTGLWDETDGFYYDQLWMGDHAKPLKLRSMVGLMPLIAVSVLEDRVIDKLPGFKKRMNWFLDNRPELGRFVERNLDGPDGGRYLLAIANIQRLPRVLNYMLDEDEFLSDFGIRSLSRVHKTKPYVWHAEGQEYRVDYEPGDSQTSVFGGNSNWRGPVWFPVNYLLIEALERYFYFYGTGLLVQCPTSSGRLKNLQQVSDEIMQRLVNLFRPSADGRRPCHGDVAPYQNDPAFKDLVLFYEYFNGDSGRGLGASHQTGWTGLVANLIDDIGTEAASTIGQMLANSPCVDEPAEEKSADHSNGRVPTIKTRAPAKKPAPAKASSGLAGAAKGSGGKASSPKPATKRKAAPAKPARRK